MLRVRSRRIAAEQLLIHCVGGAPDELSERGDGGEYGYSQQVGQTDTGNGESYIYKWDFDHLYGLSDEANEQGNGSGNAWSLFDLYS